MPNKPVYLAMLEMPYLKQSLEAQAWLSAQDPSDDPLGLEALYESGPLLATPSAEEAILFLRCCAEYEISLHKEDESMRGVLLKIAFEFESMAPGQLELAVSFSNPSEKGELSHSISCFKTRNGNFKVIGDEEYREACAFVR